MNRNKYLLYLLLCGLMLYYALPHLPLHGEKPGMIFSLAWLVLFLFAFAGNLAQFLFSQRKRAGQIKGRRRTSLNQRLRG